MANTEPQPSTIRAALLYDALDIRVEQIRTPSLLPGHVAIAPKFCGICGSDLHMYYHSRMVKALKKPHPVTGCSLPAELGHEFAGVVTAVDVGVDDLKKGDKVAVMPLITDGTCASCTSGFPNTCSQIGFVGYHGIGGGMSESVVIPRNLVFKLPESIECDTGALIEPLAVAWHGVSLIKDLSPSTTVAIIGAGAVGSAVLLCLRAQGVTTIYISEPSPIKQDFALKLGATSVHDPTACDIPADIVDVVFDCAGAPSTINAAIRAVHPHGTIVNIAVQSAQPSVNLNAMVMKELTLKCSIAYTPSDFGAVIQAIASGTLSPKAMITKRIRLEDLVRKGLEPLHGKDNPECKIVVDLSL